ncbi:MAG: aspartate 1-decarboxylase [Spirochaetales bacterium]|nr:aspartate 1-decarboxylase [Spirochaetales bacterium]
MNISMLKSKIHRATVTETNLKYEGSITIDEDLIEKANLLIYEHVHVLNCNNGCRFETYIIKGERGSKVVCLNGAAARLAEAGDKVIIISYALMSEDEARNYSPIVVNVDDDNCISEIKTKK